MKDVEALCQRAIIIDEGQIKHDGPLEQIVDRFTLNKIIALQFSGNRVPEGLDQFGELFDIQPPRAKLLVPRLEVPRTLNALLDNYPVEDVSVQDRPLEEAIAEFFIDVQDSDNQSSTDTASSPATTSPDPS